MRRAVWVIVCAVLLVAPGPGLGLPAPGTTPASAPASDRSAGWPDLWGVLRAIRDTTTATSAKTRSGADASNKTDVVEPQRMSTIGQVGKQVSDRVTNMFMSVRSSLWHLTGSAPNGDAASSTTAAPAAAALVDLETGASSDVLGKEAASAHEALDKQDRPAERKDGQQDKQGKQDKQDKQVKQDKQDKPQQKSKEESSQPQSFVSSALERVRGAGRAFTEMGRTVGRWGKAISDSVVGSTVNSAVGTVIQVFKGGKQDDDADHVCYPELGCFSLLEPWASSKRSIPRMNAPEDVQTQFFLYTRNATTTEPLLLAAGNDTVSNAHALLRDVKTFFVVHGFNDKATATWVQDMKDALLEKVDSNVILVDWAPGAQASRNYLQAASNTRIVGAELARLVEMLDEMDALPMDSVHVIGHSLGAHAAGYAGKQLGGRMGRITALDAAQPAFEDQVAEVRVAVGDARFVDVVHTNGVPFIPTLGLGVMHPVGDVDFYLNGGTVQPGCFVPKLPAVQSLMDLAALPVSVLGDMLSCSHRRAIEYFTEAVRSDCRMWGRRRAEDDLDGESDGDGRSPVVVESATSDKGAPSRNRNTPWWSPPNLGGLLAGVFSSGDKDKAKVQDSKSPANETPPASKAKGFSFSFPFLASVFSTSSSSEGRRGAAKSTLKKDVDMRPVESNGIADAAFSKSDYAISAPADAVASASNKRAALTSSSPSRRSPPPLAPPAWCVDDCLPLGLDTDLYGMRGTFNVLTADHPPYCTSQESNEVE